MLRHLLLVVILVSLSSCGLFGGKDKAEQSELDSVANQEEVIDDSELSEDSFFQDGDTDNVATLDNEAASSEGMEPGTASSVQINGDVTEKEYIVEKNETLMMISFKLYGDYARWKEIADVNRDTLGSSNKVLEGMKLKYLSTGEEFNWNPQGNPYLVKSGDTLGTISDDVYGTKNKWKKIWNNNRPLIKDPNLIFAGFTIYYIPENGNDDYALNN